MSRLVLKRSPGQSVVVDGDTRLIVVGVDGVRNTARLRLEVARPDGGVASIAFAMGRGQQSPVTPSVVVELQRSKDGSRDTRCWLMFVGPPDVLILRGELVTEGPWAVGATPVGVAEAVAVAAAGGAL